jgi:hypothetical protein
MEPLMSNAIATGGRTLVLSMDAAQQTEIIRTLGLVLGGGAAAKALAWVGARWRKSRQQPVEFTARILDDGDQLRELLLGEVKALRLETNAATERAHKAEMSAAQEKYENATLRNRLTRKDEQCKALQSQLIGLGQVPVILTGHPGREDDSGHGG